MFLGLHHVGYAKPAGRPILHGNGFRRTPGLLGSCLRLSKLEIAGHKGDVLIKFNPESRATITVSASVQHQKDFSEQQIIDPRIAKMAIEAGIETIKLSPDVSPLKLWLALRREIAGSLWETIKWPFTGFYRYARLFEADPRVTGSNIYFTYESGYPKENNKVSAFKGLPGLWKFSRDVYYELRADSLGVLLRDRTDYPELIMMMKQRGIAIIGFKFPLDSPRVFREAIRAAVRKTPFWLDYILKPLLAIPRLITAFPAKWERFVDRLVQREKARSRSYSPLLSGAAELAKVIEGERAHKHRLPSSIAKE